MFKVWRQGFNDFVEYRDENGEVLLRANDNAHDTKETHFSNDILIGSKIRQLSFSLLFTVIVKIIFLFFRIIPYNIHPSESICLRVEVKGCKYEG